MATKKTAENGSATETKKTRKVKPISNKKKFSEFGASLNEVEFKILKSELGRVSASTGAISDVMFEEDFKTLSEKLKKLIS